MDGCVGGWMDNGWMDRRINGWTGCRKEGRRGGQIDFKEFAHAVVGAGRAPIPRVARDPHSGAGATVSRQSLFAGIFTLKTLL